MVFDKLWFEKYQRPLLWFANTWIGRKILCVNGDRSSVGNNKIVKILPNSITWLSRRTRRRIELKTEFRVHEKFGKRLFYSFWPIWMLLHTWDTLFANPFAPRYNFGFDTATFYPDANPETTSVDGYVQSMLAATTWANLRGSVGNASNDFNTTAYVMYLENNTGTSNGWVNMIRSIFLFDTSSLNDSATISAATLSLYISTKGDNFAQNVGVVGSTPASNTALVNADFTQLGTTRYVTTDLDLTNITVFAYNDWVFNATGISNVSKTGVSKFGLRGSSDIDNVEPTIANAVANLNCFAADEAGTTIDPKLVVTYTLPTTDTADVGYSFFL